ncbi:MAG: hypothetical protein PHG91_10515 [Syntrophales bacterium]|nr:hypothetical protein [Syntrophales bacterium]MDD5233815.1 hypothetical protein [Syntrophales bacterium]
MEDHRPKRVASIIITYSDSSRERIDRGQCSEDRHRDELDRIGSQISQLINGRKS